MAQLHKNYFFCGIGGSGMSAIAQILRHRGHRVMGSDRNYDQGVNLSLYHQLLAQGIELFPQDGSGMDQAVDELVVSTAIENHIPEVQHALTRQVPIKKRAEVLADIFNPTYGFAIGGTSGKSTVTGMIGHILSVAGRNPTIINGGIMENFVGHNYLGNAVCGGSEITVIEADESDGTIDYYHPEIAVVTNISRDHKPLHELHRLFSSYLARTRDKRIINLDCPESIRLLDEYPDAITISLINPAARYIATDLHINTAGIGFKLGEISAQLPMHGKHNAYNALAAIAACAQTGIPLSACTSALAGFHGIRRRLQVVGDIRGIRVVDDFAHNPDKISATLGALRVIAKRLLVIYQPHGYGPTKFNRDGIITTFSMLLTPDDCLAMPEIFYAGGTADKSISSQDLINGIAAHGLNARYIPDRDMITEWLGNEARRDDIIVVMGARDDTLTEWAKAIVDYLTLKSAR